MAYAIQDDCFITPFRMTATILLLRNFFQKVIAELR